MTERVTDKKSLQGTWRRAIGSLLISVLMVLSLRWLLIEPYVIPSGSMLPTLLINDHIFVNKLAYGIRWPFSAQWLIQYAEPQRGEVIVFRSVGDSGTFMVKRVIGLPGDRVSMSSAGVLSVNGVAVEKTSWSREEVSSDKTDFDFSYLDPYEDYSVFQEKLGDKEFFTFAVKSAMRIELEEFEVPPGKLFVMGDNRDRSNDSRFWGYLPEENLLGRASFVWFSCKSEEVNALVSCSPEKIRYARFFHRVK